MPRRNGVGLLLLLWEQGLFLLPIGARALPHLL